MLLLIGPVGLPEAIMIIFVALLMFGPKKLPDIGRSLGKGIREFKKGTSGLFDGITEEMNRPPQNNQKPASKATQTLPPPASAEGQASQQEMVIDLESESGKP